jgi:hypothetical protein
MLGLLALDETATGTRTDGFFTLCCNDADEDTEDADTDEGEGNKGEKEISGEIGIALRGLSLPLLTLDI